jgi:ComEC/Rec2-related protein
MAASALVDGRVHRIQWMVAFIVFNGSAIYFLRRRAEIALALGLAAIFVTGALGVQVRHSGGGCSDNVAQFGDDEVLVTAHVTAEGNLRGDGIGGLRQRLDVETEQITAGDQPLTAHYGVRVSIYRKESTKSKEAAPMRLFAYGERLQFPAKLVAPRNFGNPGAFDYREYLAEHGIAALASTKAENIEALPGFVGRRAEFWRSWIHRGIIEKVHALWPRDAGLMDAMVIGEDAFIDCSTRVDFQRSGTYHVLVISGMNVTILAMVTFWTLRRLRLGELAASVGTMLLTVSYAVLTNVGPPIWRATLMLIVYLFARWLYREKSMLNAIGAAALALMVADPRVLFGASFELTFLCVWLVAAVGIPLLERTLEPIRRGLRNLDSTGYDHVLAPKIVQFQLGLAIVQFRLDLRMIAGRAGLELAGLALSAFWICAGPVRPEVQAGALEVTTIDVGQGDSILLVSPSGQTLLVDAGGLPRWAHSELDIGEDVVSPYLCYGHAAFASSMRWRSRMLMPITWAA